MKEILSDKDTLFGVVLLVYSSDTNMCTIVLSLSLSM